MISTDRGRQDSMGLLHSVPASLQRLVHGEVSVKMAVKMAL